MNLETDQPANRTDDTPRQIDRLFELLHEDSCINPEQRKTLRQYIDGVLNYHARIGVFGKTGVGKSTLCNALFGHDVAPVSDVDACTRQPQEILLAMAQGRGISLIDVPGVGEDDERDKEYTALYRNLLPQLDLVLWVIKADDRALSVDLRCYQEIAPLLNQTQTPIVIAVNQSDKMEPSTEWDWKRCLPGPEQRRNLDRKLCLLSGAFNLPTSHLCTVSAGQNYGLITLMEILIRSLPEEKKWGVVRETKAEIVSEQTRQEAETGVWRAFKRKVVEVVKEGAAAVLALLSSSFQRLFR